MTHQIFDCAFARFVCSTQIYLAEHAYGERSQTRHEVCLSMLRIVKKLRLLAIINVVCWGLIAGCESDPLLAPQPIEEEKGSYGLSVLPGDKERGGEKNDPNPELF